MVILVLGVHICGLQRDIGPLGLAHGFCPVLGLNGHRRNLNLQFLAAFLLNPYSFDFYIVFLELLPCFQRKVCAYLKLTHDFLHAVYFNFVVTSVTFFTKKDKICIDRWKNWD